jgi:predicted aconitase with swiveling domain
MAHHRRRRGPARRANTGSEEEVIAVVVVCEDPVDLIHEEDHGLGACAYDLLLQIAGKILAGRQVVLPNGLGCVVGTQVVVDLVGDGQ